MASKALFKEKQCCVIIPTYNNASFLDAVINDVLSYSDDVIVVNDGSTDSTLEILSKYNKVRGRGMHLRLDSGKPGPGAIVMPLPLIRTVSIMLRT